MTKEEAIAEINKAFEPAFANYIITALTKSATVSDNATNTGNDSIKTVTNAKEAENYPISEDISKDIEEINKLIFENGQAESEDKKGVGYNIKTL